MRKGVRYSILDLLHNITMSVYIFRAKQFLFAGYLANKNNYTTHLSLWK